MTLFDTIKSLTIFFAPILIPRAISLIRAVRQSVAQRRHISPKPLTPQSSRALNILFFSAALFFTLSLPIHPHAPASSIFSLTSSRFSTPTELLFTRVSRIRPLTHLDTSLRAQFTSPAARRTYLRFGPETLLSCPFCGPENPKSYLIYYISSNVLLPHLFHLLILGIVTSAPIAGPIAARWRTKFFWTGFFFLLAELSFVAAYDPYEMGVLNTALIPGSLYTRLYMARTLGLTTFDALCAGIIYLSATDRFFFGTKTSCASVEEQIDEFVETVGSSIASAMGKLHALGLAKNAIMRDAVLTERERAVWTEIIGRSGGMVGDDGKSVLDDEKVAQAVAQALAKRAQSEKSEINEADVMKKGMEEAAKFVDGVTAGLELEG
ncbi:hypothetical protein D8B26_003606 [Coccidioides posadasii str. Silveira]|uniref:Uncharacterized protein n=3 Tax=Coccidioides posadasii TaxID=199306 RepID=E9D0P5_COCPS|nr:hypothetical protein CPC735_002380 [Coccidioides posadasii C735 delta SOWgp]EER26071.1 hypothetical protein CPC735_002380 [Coccidioides posadasii C735 delta SOWgp]EFW19899.1 conserved hypothetical protein [Coccidioides posadasii str. Silveira]KMM73531.1 hypothetical protein, variant [Coccidioides posadasii RMSCC 3488]QVM08934.1 hypothetical protein D8B26_003606 [Coccidioides posadasii str. Silveira]|eukprot:XP_003068216.1 hypothetical protein CPC735_002380 [Coccidioides posadasii C735 delta SOWgp]